ncbi:hypothetical protein V6N13_096352 [Hibiscus sabdariffa]|uniref:Uncharacterized protein n=1 Tax=Hibiscus sabdariffa TaxID=183260 RepID=A0ABR2DGZ5_9ROSI
MQAPNRKRRVAQLRKPVPVEDEREKTKVGKQGSHFAVLGTDIVGGDTVATYTVEQRREVVINAGSSASAKGKKMGDTRVGSSKEAVGGRIHYVMSMQDSLDALGRIAPATTMKHQRLSVQANKENGKAGNLDKNDKIVDLKGTIVRAKPLLNASNHTIVHVIE